MTAAIDHQLELSLGTLAQRHLLVGHRIISPGDEHALLLEEATAFENSVVEVRRASGAARVVARKLLGKFGYGPTPLPRSNGGAPVWPRGVVGSLAHDSRVAIAAVATAENLGSVGIDVEPAEALPADLLPFVTTPREQATIGLDPYRGRLFFVAKEAVYKAVYPLDRKFLAHHDIEIDLENQRATVQNDRIVRFKFCISTHLVALAFLPPGSG